MIPAGCLRLPERYGARLWSMLAKGKAHKYVRRVPIPGKTTKTGKPRYRYYYHAAHGGGVGAHEHMVEGAAFQHDGGHWHIKDAAGDKLRIEHDESKETRHVTRGELAGMLEAAHAKDLADYRAKVAARVKEARESGASAKQVAALEEHARRAGVSVEAKEHSRFKPGKYTSKRGNIKDVAVFAERVGSDDYRALADKAKEHGGSYVRDAGGFVFMGEDGFKKFMAEQSGEAPKAPETPEAAPSTPVGGKSEKLPEGSFKESTTVEKPAQSSEPAARKYGRDDVDYATWYSPWAKQLATNYTREELQKQLGQAGAAATDAAEAHRRAIDATGSMTGQSQRRAHAGNSVTLHGDKKLALSAALEIHDLFPERAKGGDATGRPGPSKDDAPSGRNTVSLDSITHEWKPRFRTSVSPQYPRMKKDAEGRVFTFHGDPQTAALDASVTFGGQPHPRAAEARQRVATYNAAVKAGYKPKRMQVGGNTALVFEKDGKVLTPAGAAALAEGVGARTVVAPTDDRNVTGARQQHADAKAITQWAAKLPASTLNNPSALMSKFNDSPLSEHFTIKRPMFAPDQVALEPKGGGLNYHANSHDDLFRQLAHIAETGPADYVGGEHWASHRRVAEDRARASRESGRSLKDVLQGAMAKGRRLLSPLTAALKELSR